LFFSLLMYGGYIWFWQLLNTTEGTNTNIACTRNTLDNLNCMSLVVGL
jgi:hypothetical protein